MEYMSFKNSCINVHDLVNIIMSILNARDPYTWEHSEMVASISVLIADSMGLSDESVERIHIAAHLHDIGKIGVPDCILRKPGRLGEQELLMMKKHPVTGYEILSRLPLFKGIAEAVLYHHERYDGGGYPSLKAIS